MRLFWWEWLYQDSGLWIKPHQLKTICLITCAFVWRGRLVYAAICDKSDCFGSTLLFFFVEPIHGWSTHGFQFFLNFESYTDTRGNKSVFFKKFQVISLYTQWIVSIPAPCNRYFTIIDFASVFQTLFWKSAKSLFICFLMRELLHSFDSYFSLKFPVTVARATFENFYGFVILGVPSNPVIVF